MIQWQNGVSWEYMIALANQTNRDMWINIPAQASDDYVKQLATLVYSTLSPTLKVRFEYSNEVWNSAFQQFGYVLTQAKANSLLTATDDYTRTAQQYAFRSKQIGDIFRSVFGSQASRLVPVLGGQTSNTWWSSQGLALINSLYGSPSQFFKELAIAPYDGADLPTAPTGGWTLDTLFPELENFNSTTLSSWIQGIKSVANTYALGMSAYEGGQALTNNPNLSVSLATAANNDPRMYTLYHDLMNVWRQDGGGLYQQFSHIGGGWGLLDDIRLPGSYKWDAVMDMTLQKGDANLDGVVNYADFLILQTNYNQPGKWWWEQGDFNGDGIVNRADFDLMYANLTGLTADQWSAVNAFSAAHP